MAHTNSHSTCSCKCYCERECLCKDITLYIINNILKQYNYFSLKPPAPSLTFIYCLKGKVRFSLDNDKNNFFPEDYAKTDAPIYSMEGNASIIQGCAPLKAIALQLPLTCLSNLKWQSFFPKNTGKTFLMSKDHLPLHLRILLEEIINYQDEDSLHNVFLMHKKYELLYQQIRLLYKESSPYSIKPSERKAAHYVYSILVKDIATKPSLLKLASSVGITRTRLTELFKILFGDTVFGILRQKRLECSRNLLTNKDKNITEIAYLCGFSSPSHLTTAFTKQFGISPKQYQLNITK